MSDYTLFNNGKKHQCRIETCPKSGLILFTKSPFALKNFLKAMKGSKWNPERKCWSIANHPRNMFQIKAAMSNCQGPDNPYAWFERPAELLLPESIVRPLQDHQVEMIQNALTYRYLILAADMGLGKSLTSIEIWERLATLYGWADEEVADKVWFVGPKSALESVELDIYKWGVTAVPTLKTYERFVIDCKGDETLPQVIFFDECSGLKNPNAVRSQAAQRVTDHIRATHGTDGCVILLSGTVTAKRPSDIWSQAEIAWPGFLREGSLQAFENRYAVVVKGEDSDGNTFRKIDGWRDKEVERLPARLSGLMSVYRKNDLLDLPPQTFIRRECPAQPRTQRIAKALASSAPNVITGLTWLRALSSGFQYDENAEVGEGGERGIVETFCPKDDVLVEILKEDEPIGRMIVGASFQGSIDRVKRICREEGWDVITIDGRGWNCFTADNTKVQQHVLDFWANNANKTVLIGNPASCRFGLTLIEAKTIVVFDQNFSAEHRLQFLARNYRIGQTEETRVIDLIHLPVDSLILDTLIENKRLEDLSLGLLLESCES